MLHGHQGGHPVCSRLARGVPAHSDTRETRLQNGNKHPPGAHPHREKMALKTQAFYCRLQAQESLGSRHWPTGLLGEGQRSGQSRGKAGQSLVVQVLTFKPPDTPSIALFGICAGFWRMWVGARWAPAGGSELRSLGAQWHRWPRLQRAAALGLSPEAARVCIHHLQFAGPSSEFWKHSCSVPGTEDCWAPTAPSSPQHSFRRVMDSAQAGAVPSLTFPVCEMQERAGWREAETRTAEVGVEAQEDIRCCPSLVAGGHIDPCCPSSPCPVGGWRGL